MKQFRNTWYYVTEKGEVYNKRTDRWLKTQTNPNRYPMIAVEHPDISCRMRVHRMVAECYLENFDPALTINHKDGNKCNNHVDNLECISIADNLRHAYATGLIRRTKKDNRKRIDKELVIKLFKQYQSRTKVAKILNVSRTSISKICKNLSIGQQ